MKKHLTIVILLFSLLATVKAQTPEKSAMAQAEAQLRYLVEQTTQLRKENADKSKLMPRCVEKDGAMRLVGIGDWCSGFFPGMLWQMWDYTQDAYWRELAVSNTWKFPGPSRDGEGGSGANT